MINQAIEEKADLNVEAAATLIKRRPVTIRRMVKAEVLTAYAFPETQGHFFKPSEVIAAHEKWKATARPVTPKKLRKKTNKKKKPTTM